MDELVKAITGRLLLVGLLLVCVLVPGYLLIYSFNHGLFLSLDVIKLIILAASIPIPSLILEILIIVIMNDGDVDNAICFPMSLLFNSILFYALLLLKQFWDMSKNTSIIIVVIASIIIGAILGVLEKKSIKR